MRSDLEKLVKLVHGKWKSDSAPAESPHPDEETLSCFLERRLSRRDSREVKQHLIGCNTCLKAIVLNFQLKDKGLSEVPQGLISSVEKLLTPKEESPVLDIALRFKEKLLEILSVTGDVLVGQELVPAPVLRSRSIKEFKDEVRILKDFKDIRVEVKIENRGGNFFNLSILARRKDTQDVLKDLRVTLIKEDLELESYVSDSGSVTFEHVLLGKYTLEISTVEEKVASVLIDIKV